jgi:6-phosphogluconolactonase
MMLLLVTFSCDDDPIGVRSRPGAGGDLTPSGSLSETGGLETGVGETGVGDTGGGETGAGSMGDTGEGLQSRAFLYVGSGDDRIYGFEVDVDSGTLIEAGSWEAGAAPSFLAFSPGNTHLYAVNEGSGEVAGFRIAAATGELTLLNRVSSQGSGPAHVSVDATGQLVFAANYGEGNVTMIERLADGSLGAELATLVTGPNAHQIVADPSNGYVFVPNLGSDEVSQLVLDVNARTLVPGEVAAVGMPEGSGPRHLAFHPSGPWAYVIGELGDTMTALVFDAGTGRLTPLQTLSTLPDGVDGGDSYCAEVALGPDGRFLYGSNRGHDSLVIFAVDPATGLLSLVAHQATSGSWPRHFSLSPDGALLWVANQLSDELVSFRVDPATGLLTELATTALPAAPAFVQQIALPL